MRWACPAALILARGMMRSLAQLPLVDRPSHKTEEQGLVAWRDYSGSVSLTQLAVAELRMWLECIWHLRGSRLCRRLEKVAFVDASPCGYGAVLADQVSRGQQRRFMVSDLVGGRWAERSEEASTVFELRNLVAVCEEHGPRLQGQRLHVCNDNVGAAHVAVKGCMVNERLHAIALRLWSVCMRWDVALSTQYLCGDGIIISGADGLSRDSDAYNCMLSENAFARLWEWKGPFEVDCCASPGAIQASPDEGLLLDFVSPYGGDAIAADALTFVDHRRLYAFPPALLIGRFIAHVRREGLKIVIVVPEWPTQFWWSALYGQPSLELGRVGDVVLPGEAGIPHPFGRGFAEHNALSTPLIAVAFNL